MVYLIGPFVAVVGIVAVIFVMRHKSVEKRSMYSARRSQIEHKVRAARQRTLTPHGHPPKPAEEPPPAVPSFAQPQAQPMINYDVATYGTPPAAPPVPQAPAAQAPAAQFPAAPAQAPPWETGAAPSAAPAEAPGWESGPAPAPPPWETGPSEAPPQAPAGFDYPMPEPQPMPEPPQFEPAAEPAPMPAPSEPAWTPAPVPNEPPPQLEPVSPAAAAAGTGGAGWSVVSSGKEDEPMGQQDRRGRAAGGSSWELASGEAPRARRPRPASRATLTSRSLSTRCWSSASSWS